MPPILCLAGPTASGKSAIARALAQRWPVEIINVDSATLYQGMDIGTAKPDAQERREITHHLLDIRDPAQAYSAAEFRTDTLSLIDEIRARRHIPVLAGGTMMYFKALRDGLDDLPQADPAIRAELDRQAEREGWPALHTALARVDPVTAARLAPNDRQRVQRALEIYRISGQPMSALLTRRPDADQSSAFVTLSLEPADRAVLHARIAQRFDLMLDSGLVQEVESLCARGDLHPDLPSIRCVGYRQIWAALAGEVTMPEAREQAIAATRQLAKRQLTWLRSTPRISLDSNDPDTPNQALGLAAQLSLDAWTTALAKS